jgi:hypothetical protein
MDWSRFPLIENDPVDTAFPLLVISNSRDPITPLRSGLYVSQRFANAGFIEQLSSGHCSLAAVSICTINAVRKYFNEGKVPSPPVLEKGDEQKGNWTRCEELNRPWFTRGDDKSMWLQSLNKEERTLLAHVETIDDALKKVNQFVDLHPSLKLDNLAKVVAQAERTGQLHSKDL